MVTMLQAISTTATVPMVRVPWLEPGVLMKSLDAGAYGVICPMISRHSQRGPRRGARAHRQGLSIRDDCLKYQAARRGRPARSGENA